jgi:hypothetical protein
MYAGSLVSSHGASCDARFEPSREDGASKRQFLMIVKE